MREPKKPLPKSRENWLAEIAAAYLDAREAIPFGEVLGEPFHDADLFHLASTVALKFRGCSRSAHRRKGADEAALASYAANLGANRSVLKDPRLAFALCYLASHYGLRLLTAERTEELMADMERNRKVQARLIVGGLVARSRTPRSTGPGLAMLAPAGERERYAYSRDAMRIRSTGGPVYRLKVTLRGSKPPIWRRFLVPADIPLKRLHDCLQAVMGWSDSHLHQFEVSGVLYGTSDRESGIRRVSENKTTIAQLLRRPKDRMTYEYDFGDGWEHDVILEAILAPQRDGLYPIVAAGKRACPPEDVGGVHGYDDFLEALREPGHPEHGEMLEWVGGSFEPESFSVGEANLAIHGGWVRREPDA